MGCIFSSTKNDGGTNQAEVIVFTPGLRVPKNTDSFKSLQGKVSESMIDRLAALRTRIGAMATEESFALARLKRKTATQHGGSLVADLQQAVEDYLPVLLGLTKEIQLRDVVAFSWSNQEDDEQNPPCDMDGLFHLRFESKLQSFYLRFDMSSSSLENRVEKPKGESQHLEETIMESSLYELLSVLHLMAVLGLSQTNLMLIPKPSTDGYVPRTTEGNKKAAIQIFLKVSGILEYAVNNVMPKISEELQKRLPADLKVGLLRASAMQALGQGVEIQLGLAVDNLKATLAVKRRLACEQVKCWKQALDSIQTVHVGSGWGQKHALFIKWKLSNAHAAAYYYHGLILDEGSEENSHSRAVACLQAAESFLREGEKIHSEFSTRHPASRAPPLWGPMKYLSEKIPKDAATRALANKDTHSQQNETLPPLPDFPLALQPEEYSIPVVDASWDADGADNPHL